MNFDAIQNWGWREWTTVGGIAVTTLPLLWRLLRPPRCKKLEALKGQPKRLEGKVKKVRPRKPKPTPSPGGLVQGRSQQAPKPVGEKGPEVVTPDKTTTVRTGLFSYEERHDFSSPYLEPPLKGTWRVEKLIAEQVLHSSGSHILREVREGLVALEKKLGHIEDYSVRCIMHPRILDEIGHCSGIPLKGKIMGFPLHLDERLYVINAAVYKVIWEAR